MAESKSAESKSSEASHTPNAASSHSVFGHSSIQGSRPSMEDEVITQVDFLQHANTKYGLFAVFDGHGGKSAAEYVKSELPAKLKNNLTIGNTVAESLKSAFLDTDKDFVAKASDKSGTTAVCVLIDYTNKKLYTANAGDSRAILCQKKTTKALSNDHKATRPDEIERIKQAGGFVINGRVMGELAVSRSIGDSDYKMDDSRYVTAEPEVDETAITDDDQFLVIACDGLYDVMKNDDVNAFFQKSLDNHATYDQACEAITKHATETLRSRDNVSVVFVNLKQLLS